MIYEFTIYYDKFDLKSNMHFPIEYDPKSKQIKFGLHSKLSIETYIFYTIMGNEGFSLFSLHKFIYESLASSFSRSKNLLPSNVDPSMVYFPPAFLMEVYNDWDIESLRMKSEFVRSELAAKEIKATPHEIMKLLGFNHIKEK